MNLHAFPFAETIGRAGLNRIYRPEWAPEFCRRADVERSAELKNSGIVIGPAKAARHATKGALNQDLAA
jgi:hypothetical protein